MRKDSKGQSHEAKSERPGTTDIANITESASGNDSVCHVISMVIAYLFAIGMWVLAAYFFNNGPCGTVDTLLWHPEFVRAIEKALLLCVI